MPSTSLKLAEELGARMAAVVEGTGQSAHPFMVEAIERQTRLAEQRKGFAPTPWPRARRLVEAGWAIPHAKFIVTCKRERAAKRRLAHSRANGGSNPSTHDSLPRAA